MPFIPNKNAKKEIETAFRKAKIKADVVLRDKARDNAPVESGRLRREIVVEKDGVISNAPYSEFVEFGSFKKAANSFMRKSIIDTKNSYFDKFRNII